MNRYLLIGVVLSIFFLGSFILLHSGTWVSLLEFLRNSPLNERGDFLAGLFAPLAFLWLVVGFFMQSNELKLQREQLQAQKDELRSTRTEMRDQSKILERQTKVEEAKFEPYLEIKSIKVDPLDNGVTRYTFQAANVGHIASHVHIAIVPVVDEETPDVCVDHLFSVLPHQEFEFSFEREEENFVSMVKFQYSNVAGERRIRAWGWSLDERGHKLVGLVEEKLPPPKVL